MYFVREMREKEDLENEIPSYLLIPWKPNKILCLFQNIQTFVSMDVLGMLHFLHRGK